MLKTLNTWSEIFSNKPESLNTQCQKLLKTPRFEETSYYSFFKNVIKLSWQNNEQLKKQWQKNHSNNPPKIVLFLCSLRTSFKLI